MNIRYPLYEGVYRILTQERRYPDSSGRTNEINDMGYRAKLRIIVIKPDRNAP